MTFEEQQQKLKLLIEDGIKNDPSILFAVQRYKRGTYTLEYIESLVKDLCNHYADLVKQDWIDNNY